MSLAFDSLSLFESTKRVSLSLLYSSLFSSATEMSPLFPPDEKREREREREIREREIREREREKQTNSPHAHSNQYIPPIQRVPCFISLPQRPTHHSYPHPYLINVKELVWCNAKNTGRDVAILFVHFHVRTVPMDITHLGIRSMRRIRLDFQNNKNLEPPRR